MIDRLTTESNQDSNDSTMRNQRLTLGLDIDGYDVTVHVNPGAIEREIRRTEERQRDEINMNGSRAFDVSKLATVEVVPTDDKWDELARGVCDE